MTPAPMAMPDRITPAIGFRFEQERTETTEGAEPLRFLRLLLFNLSEVNASGRGGEVQWARREAMA